jgi:ABC-2 type transport system ATP-binding protein
MADPTPAIDVCGLARTFRSPLLKRRVPAVRDVSFTVARGEIFGLLGPNGAGKTTTIKMLLGLVKPDRGVARILGHEVPSKASRAKLGFLPENPYFYDHLTGRELLDYYGGLFGIPRAERRKRAQEMLERVGIAYAADQPLRKLSKGMMQRIGMAQALISDPEVLILDEPMSGLDPVGRKEFRDILLERRRAGTAVMFSSHILPDVEMVADRVAILSNGAVAKAGSLSELLDRSAEGVEVSAAGLSEEAAGRLAASASSHERRADLDRFIVAGEAQAVELSRAVLDAGGHLTEVTPRRATLEDLILRLGARTEERR